MRTINPISRYPEPKEDPAWALRVLDDPRISTSWGRGARFYDEPFQYQYTVTTPDLGTPSSPKAGPGGFGASFSHSIALMKAAGEAAERHSISCFDRTSFVAGSFSEVAPGLNPDDFRFFSADQLMSEPLSRFAWKSTDRFLWVDGENLSTGAPTKLPAQLVYLSHARNLGEKREMVVGTSTGAASGRTVSESILGGMLELMERDAFMIHYLQKIPGVRIDLRTSALFSEIEHYLGRFKLELQVYVLETDLPVVTIMSVLLDRSNSDVVSPRMSVGLKCSLSLDRAILGAIEESIQTRPWIRGLLQDAQLGKTEAVVEAVDDCIINRAMQWESPDLLKTASFFTESERCVELAVLEKRVAARCVSGLEQLLEFCARAGHSVYRVDVTIPAVREHGLVVSRVLMPTLQQFYLEEPYIPLGCARWKTVPRTLGLVESVREVPNNIPHFFL